jgi:hypothetical protein
MQAFFADEALMVAKASIFQPKDTYRIEENHSPF